MTAFVTFTSSTVVAWLALLSPLLVLAAVALAFTVPEVLRRRRVRRRMDGLFSPVRVASSGDAAGDGEIRPPVPCGRFADGRRGACPPLPTPSLVSVFSAPVGPKTVESSRPGPRSRTADGPGHTNPWHTFAALATVAVLLVALGVAMACQPPNDDSGTNGVVEPTSEAETDSGSQP